MQQKDTGDIMGTIKVTPLGIDPAECYECGEWFGASQALVDSVRRHSTCFNYLVAIQEEAASENPNINTILEYTIKAIGDRRESTKTS